MYNDRAGGDARQELPAGIEWLENAQNAPAGDHELVKSSHNNAQFPSTAGHAALG
jgi:hypothetical protein